MTAAPGIAPKPEYLALAASLRSLLAPRLDMARGRRTVIGVAGESGSGKSVTAVCLARELETAGYSPGVMHQDDYFRLPPRTNHEHRCADLKNVGPQEVDLELLARHVAAFRAGLENVPAPVVDYPANQFLTRSRSFSTLDVLIVEGTYTLTLADIDIRIFLEATHEDTRERRRIRNRDIEAPIIDRILEIEHGIIAPQATLADVVITRDFAAQIRG